MSDQGSRNGTLSAILIAVVLWVTLITAVVQRQALLDWWKLRGYSPPATISQIATTDTMTDYARHLLYVNKPDLIASRALLTQHCPINVEKTIILGCYKPVDEGIFLYDVSDPRLQGVVEVTAAHEMLHAGYERLSGADKANVDVMLQAYYKTGLKDERLIKTFQAYKDSGADVTNEMHSIFGTEVAILPAPLETYYKRYFTDRQMVIAEENRYESEFTSREAQVTAYDSQLHNLKLSIDANKAALDQQAADLVSLEATLNGYKDSADYAAYNSTVKQYNQKVDVYNRLLNHAKSEVEQYNQIVDRRNSIASEEQQLVQSLSGNTLPAKK